MSQRLHVWACALAALCAAPAASAAEIAAPGQMALLQLSIEIEGKASAANDQGEHESWSTRRRLTLETMLVAQQATADDVGGPGSPPPAAPPPDQTFEPSTDMEALGAAMEACGEDTACQMQLAARMMQDPQFQADTQAAQGVAEAVATSQQRPPRYQLWTALGDSAPVTGTATIEDRTESLFKTAVDERSDCTVTGQHKLEEMFPGVGWPAMLRIDAGGGTYTLSPAVTILELAVDSFCVDMDGSVRSERREPGHDKLLPAAFQPAAETAEIFGGGTDAGAGGRRLAAGSKTLTGSYGSLMGGVPMTAKVTVRWTVTAVD